MGTWSREESGLMGSPDCGNTSLSNSAKINSKDFVLCVRAVVLGGFTGMDATSATPNRKGAGKKGFSATFVRLAA